jgi:hypothetical protein
MIIYDSALVGEAAPAVRRPVLEPVALV